MTNAIKIAGFQIDCAFADSDKNVKAFAEMVPQAIAQNAKLLILPECYLSGYAFANRHEAYSIAETVPGPSVDKLIAICQQSNCYVVTGMLEKTHAGELFNSAVLLGPNGIIGKYRKMHIPFMGADRFVTPGNIPYEVYEIEGIKVGINICFDGSFPEGSRVLALMGADLILLPTNWPMGAKPFVLPLTIARAIENHVYYAAINRIGQENGVRYIGQSRILDYNGQVMSEADEEEKILYATLYPEKSRQKRIVIVPGEYEVDRIHMRRPEMYSELVKTIKK